MSAVTSDRALPLGPWPPTGRAVELALALDAVRGGGGVELNGPAGVGKTHLANRVIDLLVDEDDGWYVTRFAATEARSGIPLSALEPVLGGFDAVDTDGTTSLVVAVKERLDQLADGKSVVVHIDDAHLLDEASADAMSTLCRTRQIRLVTSVRSTAIAPSALSALWKDAVIERIDLEPFDYEETRELLRGVLGGVVVADTMRSLWDLTRGNLFYLRETVREGVRAGDFAPIDGVWKWRVEPQPGRRLVDTVRRELDRLTESQRDTLELVALCEPVAASVVLELGDRAAVDVLVELGLVDVQRPFDSTGAAGLLGIAHPLYGEAVRELVPPARRRRLYERLFAHDEPVTGVSSSLVRGESLPHLMRSVAWGIECGARVDLPRLFGAAVAASRLSRHDFVVRIADLAVAQHSGPPSELLPIRLLRAEALRFLDRADEAAREIERVGATNAELGPDGLDDYVDLRFRQADLHAKISHYGHDDVEAALVILAAAARDLGSCSADRAAVERVQRCLEIERLVHLGYAGRHAEASDSSLALLRDQEVAEVDLLPLVTPTAVGLAMSGRIGDGLGLLGDWLETARRLVPERPLCLGEMMCAAFAMTAWRGDIDVLGEWLWAATGPDDTFVKFDQVLYQLGLARLAIAQHRWADADQELSATVSRFRTNNAAGLGALAFSSRVLAAAASGDLERAKQYRAEAVAFPLNASRVAEADCLIPLLMAGVAFSEPGSVDAALAYAHECGSNGLHFGELMALHVALLGAMRFGRPVQGDIAARVVTTGAHVDGPLSDAIVRHAEAVAAHDDALVAVAVEAISRCGGWVPAVRKLVSLSRRQRQVADLAVAGLSSKEIAERLVLSVRTVESHLNHIFTRLDVHSRAELAAALAATR